jgi:hypothetical protein
MGGSPINYEAQPQRTDVLDSPKYKRLHSMMLEWLDMEIDKQGENRYQMALDEDYYDGMQWSVEDAQSLIEVNQAPLVYNLCKPLVNWVAGTERRTRVDYKILPRGDEDREAAITKTKLMKYVSDANNEGYENSEAFASMVKSGLSWLEDGVIGEPGREPVYSGWKNWREVLRDSNGTRLDTRDWRYIFDFKAIDTDLACAMFPNRIGTIKAASSGTAENEVEINTYYMGRPVNRVDEGDWTSFSRRGAVVRPMALQEFSRVNVILHRCEYKVPTRGKVMRGSMIFHNEIFDQENEHHQYAVNSGEVTLQDSVYQQMYICIFSRSGIMWHGKSPYKHNNFSLTPMGCYRRARDNEFYGVIRDIRDPQDEFNKRTSKALWLMNTNVVTGTNDVLSEEVTIDDLRREAARPDAVLLHARGAELNVERGGGNIAQAQLDYAFRVALPMTQMIAGVTSENLGRDTNANSGIAIQRKQDQGSTITYTIFDNARLARQMRGEKQLCNIEQFMTDKRILRIIGPKGKPEFLRVNDYDESTETMMNPVAQTKADFVIDEVDYNATTRQMMATELMNTVTKLPPEISVKFLPLVIDQMDIPNKDEWVAMLRQINGQPDPEQQQTPEMLKQQQAQEQKQQVADQLAMRERVAQVEKIEAEVQKVRNEATAATQQVGATQGPEAEQAAMQVVQPYIEKLQTNLTDLQAQLSDLRNKEAAQVEVARINAGATVDTAAHARASEEAKAATKAQDQTLQRRVDEMMGALSEHLSEVSTVVVDIGKRVESSEKKAEERAAKAEKDRIKREADAEKAEADKPMPPIEVILPSEPTTKSIEMTLPSGKKVTAKVTSETKAKPESKLKTKGDKPIKE